MSTPGGVLTKIKFAFQTCIYPLLPPPIFHLLAFFPPLFFLSFGPKQRIGLRDPFRLLLRGPYKITLRGASSVGAWVTKRKKHAGKEDLVWAQLWIPTHQSPSPIICIYLIGHTHPKTKKKRDGVCNQNGCYCCQKIQSPSPPKEILYTEYIP